MNRGAHRRKTPTRFGVELGREWSPVYEANRIVQMVRSGLLTVEGARALIRVNEGEVMVLRKILEPHTADAALLFRRNVLRLFNALVQPIRPRGRRMGQG